MGGLIVLADALVQQARFTQARPASLPRANLRATGGGTGKSCGCSTRIRCGGGCPWNQRNEISGAVADRRLQLSHLEEHIRRLEAKWRELQQQAASLENVGSSRSAEAEATKKIGATAWGHRHSAARIRRGPSGGGLVARRYFSIISVRRTERHITGGRSTSNARRPAFRLQPEDISSGRGFLRDLLARQSTRRRPRTTREYFGAGPAKIARSGEPYPLLVVRPDGAVPNGVARAP